MVKFCVASKGTNKLERHEAALRVVLIELLMCTLGIHVAYLHHVRWCAHLPICVHVEQTAYVPVIYVCRVPHGQLS